MQVPHVRETIADRELETWLLIDQSASLDFGTADCEKRDLARERRPRPSASSPPAAATGSARSCCAPARRRSSCPLARVAPHLQALLHNVITAPRKEGAGPTDLAAGLERLGATMRRRGLAVVISDWLDPTDWAMPLRRLAVRHDVLAIEVVDPREMTLADVGMLHVVDPETGRVREIQTSDAELRERYAAAAQQAARRDQRHDPVRRRPPPRAAHRRGLAARARALRHAAPPIASTRPLRRVIRHELRRADPAVVPARRRSRSPRSTSCCSGAGSSTPCASPTWRCSTRSRRSGPVGDGMPPAFAFLIAIATLVVAFARPTHDEKVPRERATVIVAIDTSLSMEADDITPTRIEAVKTAATSFVNQLPREDQRRHRELRRQRPARGGADHRSQQGARRRSAASTCNEGTAIGEAIFTSIDAIKQTVTVDDSGQKIPARIVLMSDGKTTVGRSNDDATAAAKKAHIPVSTIAFGTDHGEITVPESPDPIPVPVDKEALQTIAEQTGGSFFTAASAKELQQVYTDIGSSIGFDLEPREITTWFVGAALARAAGDRRHVLGLVLRLP